MNDESATDNHADGSGGGILVVEDEVASAQLLSYILSSSGHQVRLAYDGHEALEQAQRVRPDLILLDVMMPGLNGFQVCERLKAVEATRDTPVLFLSALAEVDDKIRAFTVGATDYITKPFHAREVLARVTTHLSLRRLQKQLEAANGALEQQNAELQKRNAELQQALHTIQTLSGLIPICAWCGRKIEDEEGNWVPVETYIQAHSHAQFTHGMCPDCFTRVREDAVRTLRARTTPSPPEG
ncbi:MAG TPA: response regulator [Anaerolineae bacterium]|nr:response regulator [Anaerolineae bacterium]